MIKNEMPNSQTYLRKEGATVPGTIWDGRVRLELYDTNTLAWRPVTQDDFAGSGAVAPIASLGRSSIALNRVDYTGLTITTAGYTTLIASTSDSINQLLIFSSTNKTLVLAVGAAASEVDKVYIPPGGFGHPVELLIPLGSRISVKAVDANPTTGVLLISYLK